MLKKRETGKDYAFLFKSAEESIKTLFKVNYEPDTLLADSSGAITNGFTIGFGYKPPFRITCWVHALRAFDNKYSKFLSKEMKIKTRHDLFKLQTASSPDIFKNLRKLLL
jgi:hypothetical protein